MTGKMNVTQNEIASAGRQEDENESENMNFLWLLRRFPRE